MVWVFHSPSQSVPFDPTLPSYTIVLSELHDCPQSRRNPRDAHNLRASDPVTDCFHLTAMVLYNLGVVLILGAVGIRSVPVRVVLWRRLLYCFWPWQRGAS